MPGQLPLIRVGPLAEWLINGAYFLGIITFLAGLDFHNVELMGVAFGSVMIGMIGQRVAQNVGAAKDDGRRPSTYLPSVLKWVGYDLAAFAFADAFVPHFFDSMQFLGFPVASDLAASGIAVSSVLSIGLVFTNTEAVMEELGFRVGLANGLLKALRLTSVPGLIFVALLDGVLFGAAHVFAYGPNLPVLVILGSAGTVFTVGAFRTMEALTSIMAHMINNTVAWLNAALILTGGNLALFVPAGPAQALLMGVSFAFGPMVVFALKRSNRIPGIQGVTATR